MLHIEIYFLHLKCYKLTSSMHKYELTMNNSIFIINIKEVKILWSFTQPHVILNLYHYSIASVEYKRSFENHFPQFSSIQ